MIESFAFTYTLVDLQLLRDCLRCNDSLSGALTAFESMRDWGSAGFPWRQYLEFAEKITQDENFPEKWFKDAALANTTFISTS